MSSNISTREVLLSVLALLVGIYIGFTIKDLTQDSSVHQYIELREKGWEYINPLLDCEQARETAENRELKPFRSHIEHFIENELNKKWADRVSVYFRDLNNGPWFAIGDTQNFYPASLLKVPVMIAVLKQAETHPELLKKKIPYTDKKVQAYQNEIPKKLAFGRSYTVEELLRQMIVYSDNVPTYLLDNFVDINILHRTYIDLGIYDPYREANRSFPVFASPSYNISVETYASFFRVLFNASYLSKQMSEKALALLTECAFKDGLVAGVPPHIKVAHKYGNHESGENLERKQLHDCGIVYYPDHPYLLCIMTSGNSYDKLDDAIVDISHMIYKEIEAQHPH